MGLPARWLDVEQISEDCVTQAEDDSGIRRALAQFRTQLEQRVNALQDPVSGELPPDVSRAHAEGMGLYQESLAVVDAHAELQAKHSRLLPDQIGSDLITIKDADVPVFESLALFRTQVQSMTRFLKDMGTAVEGPAFSQARATCRRLYEDAMATLTSHRALGIHAPWISRGYHRDLLCTTLEAVAAFRQRLDDYADQLDRAAVKCAGPDGTLPPAMAAAVERCKSLHREATRVAQAHEDDIRQARMSDALRVDDIQASPPDEPPPTVSWKDGGPAPSEHGLGEASAAHLAGRAMEALQHVYKPGHAGPPYQSNNKANLGKGFDEEQARVERAWVLPRPAGSHAIRKAAWHNCGDLVLAGARHLMDQHPPVETTSISLSLQDGLFDHEIGILNAGHRLPLDKDMTRWPPDVWVFDRWTGKQAVRACDYPQYFLSQMRKWNANEQKFIRSNEQIVDGISFYRWLRPLDARWVEGVIHALRNVPPAPGAGPAATVSSPGPGPRSNTDTASASSLGAAPRTPDAEDPSAR